MFDNLLVEWFDDEFDNISFRVWGILRAGFLNVSFYHDKSFTRKNIIICEITSFLCPVTSSEDVKISIYKMTRNEFKTEKKLNVSQFVLNS